MAALPYIQLYIADYLADTAHLNAAQHGAYLLLIFNYWQRGRPLKNCNERLANVARMSSDEWNKNVEVIKEFFTVTDEEWIHHRIEDDLVAVKAKSDKARAAGKASAERRLSKRSANVKQTLNYTDTDTDTDTDIILLSSSPCSDDQISQQFKPPPKKKKQKQTAPFQEIINLYHDMLPENPQLLVLNDKRKGHIQARWDEYSDLELWRQFFERVSESKFLMGEIDPKPGHKRFKANLPWLINPENWAKVMEGYYS